MEVKDTISHLEAKIRSGDKFRCEASNAPHWIQAMIEDELIKLAEQHLALCKQRLDFFKSL